MKHCGVVSAEDVMANCQPSVVGNDFRRVGVLPTLRVLPTHPNIHNGICRSRSLLAFSSGTIRTVGLLANRYALFLYARANYTQAESLYRRALAIDEAMS
jgi:hypothetical protein